MNNLNLTVIGQIGAGKTQFVKRLLQFSPRAVILDPMAEYDGTVFESFETAALWWVQHRFDREFRMCFRGGAGVTFSDDDLALEPFRFLLRLIAHSQRVDHLAPLGLILEESTLYAARNDPWPEIRTIYLYGRRWRINTISVAQSDVDISTQVRRNSQVVVALRNVKPSTDFARYFGGDLERIGTLDKITPEVTPVLGTHYLTYPPDLDVAAEWERLNHA